MYKANTLPLAPLLQPVLSLVLNVAIVGSICSIIAAGKIYLDLLPNWLMLSIFVFKFRSQGRDFSTSSSRHDYQIVARSAIQFSVIVSPISTKPSPFYPSVQILCVGSGYIYYELTKIN